MSRHIRNWYSPDTPPMLVALQPMSFPGIGEYDGEDAMSETYTPYKLDRPLTDDERNAIALLRQQLDWAGSVFGYDLSDHTDEELFENTMNFGRVAAMSGVTAQQAADAFEAFGRILRDE